MAASRAQIDKLGARLLLDPISSSDYEMLDAYRETFRPAYEAAVHTVAARTGLPVSGRAAKSTSAIVAKLGRGTTKLSQMQDIAGCRIVVGSIGAQDATTGAIASGFAKAKVIDRRVRPSHGYRAVHVVAWLDERLVEVQVRTELQHQWAQLSERLADRLGQALKYGEGPHEARALLDDLARRIADSEENADAGPTPSDDILTLTMLFAPPEQVRLLIDDLVSGIRPRNTRAATDTK